MVSGPNVLDVRSQETIPAAPHGRRGGAPTSCRRLPNATRRKAGRAFLIWGLAAICALAATIALIDAANGTSIRASGTSHDSSCRSEA